jgi:hypothetical protein
VQAFRVTSSTNGSLLKVKNSSEQHSQKFSLAWYWSIFCRRFQGHAQIATLRLKSAKEMSKYIVLDFCTRRPQKLLKSSSHVDKIIN